MLPELLVKKTIQLQLKYVRISGCYQDKDLKFYFIHKKYIFFKLYNLGNNVNKHEFSSYLGKIFT